MMVERQSKGRLSQADSPGPAMKSNLKEGTGPSTIDRAGQGVTADHWTSSRDGQ